MNKFIEMIRQNHTILFSEILNDIPSDEVLCELFPDPDCSGKSLVSSRGLQVLKLRLEGLKQPEIAEQLDLSPGQVAYASMMTKNCLHKSVPPYIEVDIPSLRKILRMDVSPPRERKCLSELLRDMPSDEELKCLFIEAGKIVGGSHKLPVTNKDLQLLLMRQQKRSYESIAEEIGLEATEVRHHISLTLKRIRRYLKIEMDVPELYKRKAKAEASVVHPVPPPVEKPLSILTDRQKAVWELHDIGLTRKQIAEKLGISYNAVTEHIHHAERRFREYERYVAAKERNKESVFLPLTRGEVKIIIRALEQYEEQLEKSVVRRADSDWKGKLPYEVNIIADLYERAQMAAFGSILHRMPPNWDKDK